MDDSGATPRVPGWRQMLSSAPPLVLPAPRWWPWRRKLAGGLGAAGLGALILSIARHDAGWWLAAVIAVIAGGTLLSLRNPRQPPTRSVVAGLGLGGLLAVLVPATLGERFPAASSNVMAITGTRGNSDQLLQWPGAGAADAQTWSDGLGAVDVVYRTPDLVVTWERWSAAANAPAGSQVRAFDVDGELLWEREYFASEGPATAYVLADLDGAVAVAVCDFELGTDCTVTAIERSGAERWSVGVHGAFQPAERTRSLLPEPRLELPPVAVLDLTGTSGRRSLVAFDPDTGAVRTLDLEFELAAVGDGFVAVYGETDGYGCELRIFDHALEERSAVDLDCTALRYPFRFDVAGATVSIRQHGETWVGHVDASATDIVDGGTWPAALASPAGAVVDADDDGYFETLVSPTAEQTFGGTIVAAGANIVVVTRPAGSWNPFAPEGLQQVQVIDLADGTVCGWVRSSRIGDDGATDELALDPVGIDGCWAVVDDRLVGEV